MNRCVNPLCPHCNPGAYGPLPRFLPRQLTEDEKAQAEANLTRVVREAMRRLADKREVEKAAE